MGEWKRVPVSEVCSLIVDCVNKTAPTVDSITPYKMIRTPNIRNGRISLDGCKHVEKEVYEKWTRRAKVEIDDVLLTREAPMGEVGLFNSSETVFLGQRIMQYRANREVLNPHFLLYSFLSNDLQHQFRMHDGSGSVVSHIRVPDCLKFEINLPELNTQNNIVTILKSLDDKIELNRKMNETLEEMARAIFKSWFVDFDPVHAKARGEKPAGMPEEIANLFPSEFVHSDLLGKPIPKGWLVKPLKELIDFNPTRKLQKGSVVPYVEMSSLPEQGMSIKSFYEREFKSGSKFVNGDTLFARITPCLENGKTAFVDCLKDSEVGWGSTEFIVMRSKAGISNFFSYLVARSEWFRTVAIGSMTGSSGRQRASKEALEELLVAVPCEAVFKAFNDLIDATPEKIKASHRESQTLTELRDSLLPKLISGEIEV